MYVVEKNNLWLAVSPVTTSILREWVYILFSRRCILSENIRACIHVEKYIVQINIILFFIQYSHWLPRGTPYLFVCALFVVSLSFQVVYKYILLCTYTVAFMYIHPYIIYIIFFMHTHTHTHSYAQKENEWKCRYTSASGYFPPMGYRSCCKGCYWGCYTYKHTYMWWTFSCLSTRVQYVYEYTSC